MLNCELSNTTFEPRKHAFTQKFEVEEVIHYEKRVFCNWSCNSIFELQWPLATHCNFTLWMLSNRLQELQDVCQKEWDVKHVCDGTIHMCCGHVTWTILLSSLERQFNEIASGNAPMFCSTLIFLMLLR